MSADILLQLNKND